MATFGTEFRRGLPRTPGGDPWPPANVAPNGDAPGSGSGPAPEAAVAQHAGTDAGSLRVATPEALESEAPEAPGVPGAPGVPEAGVAQHAGTDAASPRVVTGEARIIRRGLPRVPGGEPWPPADAAPVPVSSGIAAGVAATAPSPSPRVQSPAPAPAHAPVLGGPAPGVAQSDSADAGPSAPREGTAEQGGAAVEAGARPVRRGLPRVPGGEPWPAASVAPTRPVRVAQHAETDAATSQVVATEARAGVASVAPEARVGSAQNARTDAATLRVATSEAAAPAAPRTVTGVPLETPLPFTRTVWPGVAASTRPPRRVEPRRAGPFTRVQWAGAVVVGGGGLLVAAAMAVALVRWLLSTGWGVDFLATYPGEYHLPEGAPVGFPAWLGWQHFFNVFLMVLIIRSGLQVRTEKRPTAFWSPRGSKRRKISLNLWFHQALDILWLVNGAVFVVLLFVTGQWMRIIPTSWEVFPNAISAALQYVSLDWPTENGWVNYNSLQQLTYFATVFVAAPLAAITGVRMSGVWPKDATGLNRAYPVEWARAVHFPVMIYFVVFIFFHVVLVFATGALRNLNHMYAAQGSVDPNAYADNWAGFWIFAVSILVIAGAWAAARPLVLAPIARLFGTVSGR